MDKLPLLSEDLIKELDQLYRPLNAEDVLNLGDKQLAFKAGKRQVVEHLQMVLARAQEEDLEI